MLGKLEERVGDKSEMPVLHMDLQALSINDECNERRKTHIETQLNIIKSDRLKCSLRLFGLQVTETNEQELLALVANEVLDVTEESDSLDITSVVSVRRIGEKQEWQAREDVDDERKHDDTRMVLLQFSRSNDTFKLFKYTDTLRFKGIRISNDPSHLQRQQLKEIKKKGLIGYFKNGELCINA
ncbi:hypothetical protein DPMN_112683 [Dreissena polymorpha]|uniref:Uncharacterized protein n=1 Tax=Dreissena polymorpha TaxID=45954 RepID=A0A9D4KG43_DREPO|nr:hypothetical protein DPMN_112683 [Dreissena polymorpha]